MFPYLGLNYNSEEVSLENSNNVYMDGEFRLVLPEGTGLVSMPRMSWIRVRGVLSLLNLCFTFFHSL